MLDKETQHIFNKTFINNSWKSMKGRLDAEIPVAASKINKTILSLSALLFIFALSTGYLLFNKFNSTPIAQLTKETISYQKVYVEVPTIVEKEVIKYITPSAQQNIFYNTAGNQKKFFAKPLEENDLNSNVTQLNSKSIQPQNLNDLSSINNINQNEVETEENYLHIPFKVNNIEPLINKTTSARKLSYNIGLLSFVSHNLDYTGYGFTTGIKIPLSRKIGMSTGLAINFASRDFFIYPFIGKNQPNQLKGLSNLEDEATYYDGLKSFNQIYVPLDIHYNVSNLFSVSTGMKLRYTYNEDVDRLLKSRASKKISKTQTVENAFFNQTNIGFSAGITYKYNHRINFILDTEWGLSSIINKNQFYNPSTTKYDLNLINLTTNLTF
ncbi:MAG: outer membrane beta-barrel protein [Saprospiraceae bacterium]|nr:outer membrane beta-barrel protein [Bacteroidia bacterium]NNL93694.1 outer membrane beta-barrel protein [Saprospiraceae bacterium]